MTACSIVHVDVRETQVHQVRERDQHSAQTDQQRVQEWPPIHVYHDAGQQQRDTGHQEKNCAEAPMPAKTDRERRQCKHTRECDEHTLERMIGKEAETECGQRRDHERQCGAVQRTQEGRGGPEPIRKAHMKRIGLDLGHRGKARWMATL